jgi:SAM-dependent methyltransferase
MRVHQHKELLGRWQRSLSLYKALQTAIRPGISVLDAGCGPGLSSLWALQLGAGHVTGADLDDVQLARSLADENGYGDRARFLRTDLRTIQVKDLGGPCDLMIAMVYYNDPRQDEEQSKLVMDLKERLIARDGDLLPDRVVYRVSAWDWPDQDFLTRAEDIAQFVRHVETRCALRLESLCRALLAEPDLRAFPKREASGALARPTARQLSPWSEGFRIDYRKGSSETPATVELTANAAGIFNTLIWTQELYYRGLLIFENESISWIENPTRVDPGSRVRMALDSRWRKSNVLTATTAHG